MTKKVNEGLAELAGVVDQDHEVQMARADLYKIAKYAIKLHEMMKNITEAEGLEAWQQAKITKAADYIGSVYHSLDYDQVSGLRTESRKFRTAMTEAEQTEYKAILEKAKSKAQQKFMDKDVTESIFSSDEAAEFRSMKESPMMDKAVAAVHRHVIKGKDLSDVINNFERVVGDLISMRELYNAYINQHGDPKTKVPNRDGNNRLMKKYGFAAEHTTEAPIDKRDDDKITGGRRAVSPMQAKAWADDADDRNADAIERMPEFFNPDHMRRIKEAAALIDKLLGGKAIYINHRVRDRETRGPVTAIKVTYPTFPKRFASSAVKAREFEEPLKNLGMIRRDNLKNKAGNNEPGIIFYFT